MEEEAIITAILAREGGFCDRAEDRGGPTNHGITRETLAWWRGHDVGRPEVESLSEAEAREIYRRLFQAPEFEAVPAGPLRDLLSDFAVNHGPRRAVRWLQRVLGVESDGDFGPITRAALAGADPRRVYLGLCAARARIFGGMITDDPSQARFARGWANRLAGFIEAAP